MPYYYPYPSNLFFLYAFLSFYFPFSWKILDTQTIYLTALRTCMGIREPDFYLFILNQARLLWA